MISKLGLSSRSRTFDFCDVLGFLFPFVYGVNFGNVDTFDISNELCNELCNELGNKLCDKLGNDQAGALAVAGLHVGRVGLVGRRRDAPVAADTRDV